MQSVNATDMRKDFGNYIDEIVRTNNNKNHPIVKDSEVVFFFPPLTACAKK
ncbi:hypothetical protein [Anoxynatronum sibiricum]|uniref:Uncharacterized protein n=1 Tax=Anoxynatronum sibiricum TaxID=210623 RepID=A0ABU9VW39_9CLOT